MRFVADLHIHSHHSIATSKQSDPEHLYLWGCLKGLSLIGTGDFTHPAWRDELEEKLEPAEEGLFRLKPEYRRGVEPEIPEACRADVRFILSVEISSIYKRAGRTRKVHNLILMPGFEAAHRLSAQLERIGNISSDGRPILGLDSRDLLQICLDACPEVLFIPAHIWTPHFSLFGAYSGFDRFEACYDDLSPHIWAVETGLSSDPPMNWRLSALDRYALVSHSDAHSPQKLAREADLFDTECSYPAIVSALKDRDPMRFLGTLEFFPEEGKYHYDGHRNCGVCWEPSQTIAAGGTCPACGKRVTVGVLHRVEMLADRPKGARPQAARHYERLVPLPELIAEVLGVRSSASGKVAALYRKLLHALGPELAILRELPIQEVARAGGPVLGEAVRRARAGQVVAHPGYDGAYGRIQVFGEGESRRGSGQAALFALPDGPTLGPAQQAPLALDVERPAAARSRESADTPRALADGRKPPEPLNPEQQEAVLAQQGPILVAAGPGTGKTRTLACRVAHLILRRAVDPERILAVTFTNKAAQEMRRRVRDLLADERDVSALTVGTFHRIALGLLREYAGSDFQVLDAWEAGSLLEDVLAHLGIQAGPRRVEDAISRAKGLGVDADALDGPDEVARAYAEYQRRLRALHLWDYDDLLLDAVRLVETDGDVLRRCRERFVHLLVDEFQDVNALQYRLVKALAGDGRNLFAIGDPDQSIYGFRGADRRHFYRLSEDFPSAHVIALGTNYRSTPEVLAAAGGVIARDTNGLRRSLASTRPSGPAVRLMRPASELAQGIAVVHEIGRMVGGATMLQTDRHVPGPGAPGREGAQRGFGDIAVLFRTGREAQHLEECFLKEGIPYRVVGQKSFLAHRSVRELLAFLRHVREPDNDLWFRCALRIPSFDPGVAALEALHARQGGLGASLADTAQAMLARQELPASAAAKLGRLLDTARRWRPRIETGPAELALKDAQAEIGLRPDEALAHLLGLSAGFSSLPEMLAELPLCQDGDYERLGRPGVSEAVSLMTLHAAKGLEFPVVFIAGVEDGLIPYRGEAGDVEEERRLFYVGLTRARDELVLLACQSRMQYGKRVRNRGSPFLADIPEGVLVEEAPELPQGERKRARQLRLF